MRGSQAIRASLAYWNELRESIIRSTPVDTSESEADKKARIEWLEANDEEWMKYYFPQYIDADFAPFQSRFLQKIFTEDQIYIVNAWAREHAKTAISMMAKLKLMMTGRIKNLLLFSKSFDNAIDLFTPMILQLESNQRLINDYGLQQTYGSWDYTKGKWVTQLGCSIRCIGLGQSPRGTRNEEVRPDYVEGDDADDDISVRNPERVKKAWNWVEQALIPAMSIKGNRRIVFTGNIIAKDSIITRAIKMADYHEVVNILDENGQPSWNRYTLEQIQAILSKISYISAQKEYFNNPIEEGTVFKEISFKQMMPLKSYKFLVAYGDPSFKDSKKNDFKAVILIGKYKHEYHIIKAYVEQTTTDAMAGFYKDIHDFVNGRVPVYYYIEANATQDLIFEQIKRTILKNKWGFALVGDYRKKGDKFSRIEAALEPINRNGQLYFNAAEENNPHMQRLKDQFLALTPQLLGHDDGPDAVEGGKYIIDRKVVAAAGIQVGRRGQGGFINKKKY